MKARVFLKVSASIWLCLLFLGGCTKAYSPENAEQNIRSQKITAKQAKNMMDNHEVIIIDVRTPEEYNEKHIQDAILLPNETIGDHPIDALPDQDAILLIYCRSGRRSAEAASKLIKLGYTKVYDFGGIVDWPYETEG